MSAPGRKNHYGARLKLVPTAPTEASVAETEGVEPVVGAPAIADLLQFDGRPRRVYRLLEQYKGRGDGPPIRKVPGLGLVADRQALLSWWRRTLTESHPV